jgi:UDP-sugar pyrophosphorylase
MSSSFPIDEIRTIVTDKGELRLLQELYETQPHLLDAFSKDQDTTKTNTKPKLQLQLQSLAKQLFNLNKAYPGGLAGYIQKAKKLLQDSKDGVNPLDGWFPSVPEGEKFDLGTAKYGETEEIGRKLLGKTGFVLVAGGLGERLGYNGAKVSLRYKRTAV